MDILFNITAAECILPTENPYAITESYFKDSQAFQDYLTSVKNEQQNNDHNNYD